MRRNTFVRVDNPSKRVSTIAKPYTPYMPVDVMDAIQRRSSMRSDAADTISKHWGEYGPNEIQNMYIAMGLGNPPNMSWVQPAADPVRATLKADRARAQAAVDDRPYVMRSIQPLSPPEQPPVTSPLDQSLYPFPQLQGETNRRNHSEPEQKEKTRSRSPRFETLVDEAASNAGPESGSSSSVFVISKDDLIKFLSLLCALMLGFILYLVSRK